VVRLGLEGFGLGRVHWPESYRVRIRVRIRVRVRARVRVIGSDVCQGGGDRIVTLKVVFLHFIWWE